MAAAPPSPSWISNILGLGLVMLLSIDKVDSFLLGRQKRVTLAPILPRIYECWNASKRKANSIPHGNDNDFLDAVGEDSSDPDDYEAEEYIGPIIGDISKLEGGIQIPEYGIILGVGPSTIAEGQRGLFISVDEEEVDQTFLPAGAPLCRYAQGTLVHAFQGDKTVGFAFSDPDTEVFFGGHLVPLREALAEAAAALPPPKEDEGEEGGRDDTRRLLAGHLVGFDAEGRLRVEPDPEYAGPRYFVPAAGADFTARGLGQYANDLAGRADPRGMGRGAYLGEAARRNLLQIAWRLELAEGGGAALAPSWPVTMLARNVLLTSPDPMEVGCTYGWRFWEQQAAAAGRQPEGAEEGRR